MAYTGAFWCRPSRFARQYSHPQSIPEEPEGVGSTHVFSDSFISLVTTQDKRGFHYVAVDPKKPAITTTEADYKTWISGVGLRDEAGSSKAVSDQFYLLCTRMHFISLHTDTLKFN